MSQIPPQKFFSLEKLLFIEKCRTDVKPWWTKVSISPVRNIILNIWDPLFELMQIKTQRSKNYLTIFFMTKSRSFWKENWLGAIKVTPKINKKQQKRSLRIFNLPTIRCKLQYFYKHVVILYYTGPNFLTLKVH